MIELEGLEDIDSSVINAINKGLIAKDKNIHSPPYTLRATMAEELRKKLSRFKRRLKNLFLDQNKRKDTYPFY